MKPSLSVLLSIRDVQSRLADWITSHLDVLPELTPRFELVIVDLGSADATPEVADELARSYPQISILTQPSRLDAAGALRMGLAHTSGDLVLVCAGLQSEARDLPKLWSAAQNADAVVARTLAVESARASMLADVSNSPELMLFHRRVATAWHGMSATETLLAYLIRKRYRITQLALRSGATRTAAALPHPAIPKPKLATGNGSPATTPRSHRTARSLGPLM